MFSVKRNKKKKPLSKNQKKKKKKKNRKGNRYFTLESITMKFATILLVAIAATTAPVLAAPTADSTTLDLAARELAEGIELAERDFDDQLEERGLEDLDAREPFLFFDKIKNFFKKDGDKDKEDFS